MLKSLGFAAICFRSFTRSKMENLKTLISCILSQNTNFCTCYKNLNLPRASLRTQVYIEVYNYVIAELGNCIAYSMDYCKLFETCSYTGSVNSSDGLVAADGDEGLLNSFFCCFKKPKRSTVSAFQNEPPPSPKVTRHPM